MADQKKQRIVVKITDLETGVEQISGELTVIPGFGFCCSCSTSSLTSPPVVFHAAEQTKAK